MIKLRIEFPSRRDLLDAYAADPNLGGLFIPGSFAVKTGDVVLVDIITRNEKRTLRSSGMVRWRRVKETDGLAAGVGVELNPAARPGDPLRHGPLSAFRDLRRGVRYDVSLGVDCRLLGMTMRKRMRDISKTGAFIETDIVPTVGMMFPVKLTHPDGRTTEINVTSVRKHANGVGVEFAPKKNEDYQAIGRIMASTALAHLEGNTGAV